MGNPSYTITQGKIYFEGRDITTLPVNERAKAGIFLAFQAPIAVPGITVENFIRNAKSTITGKTERIMYLGNDHQVFDFSYWVPQQGVKTETDIVTTGSLMEQSRKYFRGTIDFLRGGKQAVGSESDTCLLLSPGAHSISIPLLLCKEDDVVGNHAALPDKGDFQKMVVIVGPIEKKHIP